jgi:hypothetical protein
MQVFSDISVWWLFPWMAVSLVLGILYYRKQKVLDDLSRWKKWALIALRSFTLFVLGVLLFGLIVENKDYKTEKPLFITLVDNSMSMLNYQDSSSVETQIASLESNLKTKYGDRFDFKSYVVGSDISEGERSYSEKESNLDKGFDFIYNQYYNRNIGGICFVSDGNFNTGKNPVYSAEKISLTPVFSIGVGDTVLKRDQFIRNLAVNDVAFLNNQFPIEVDIEAHKMGNSSSTVSLWNKGQKLASEEVKYVDGSLDFVHVSFVLEAKETGFVNYTVKVERKDNESSYDNNERSFYVEVIDSRSKILILAKAPHPDLTAIRQVLDADENTEVVSKLISDWDGSLNDYALLIWHDPGHANNNLIADKIRTSKTPVLYLVGGQSTNSNLKKLNIGLNYPGGTRFDEVQGSASESFQLFEVSEDLKKAIRNFPPLTVRFGGVQVSGGNVLISQRIGPVVKNDPVLTFKTESGNKYGVLVGEGLWRWKISEYADYGENKRFNELIQKTVQYLTVKKNTEPLRINLPNRFNVIDDVILNAEFYNSSFQRIVGPDISLILKNEEGVDIKYSFAKNTSDYVLSLGRLKKGKYSWVASTTFDGKKYEKSGVFIVDDISLEALSTHADHNLLKQIAAKTNGKFYSLANAGNLVNDIESRKDIASITYEESSFDDLIDWKWLFFLLILSLAAEWFIRRYSGSY